MGNIAAIKNEPQALSIFDAGRLHEMQCFAEVMAQSRITLPKHLQGQPADCLAIVMQAAQWGMNPFSVAQKTHLVNGSLGYEAQLVNAVINAHAPLRSRLAFEWFGDWSNVNGKQSKDPNVGVVVSAVLNGEAEPRTLRVAMSQVGPVRNSPLWDADPRQQLAYLATKRWARLYCPDVILGVYELEDSQPINMGTVQSAGAQAQAAAVEPAATKTESVKSKLASRAKPAPVEAPAAPTETLESVLQAFRAASTLAELKEVANLANGLAETDKIEARKAYASRAEELQTPPAQQMSAEAAEFFGEEPGEWNGNEQR